MSKLNIKYMSVNNLIPYTKNPRKNDKAVEYVANSIKEFGFKVPIVLDKNNEIIAGHTRLKAAKKLKIEEVPCIIADDLNDEQIKAFRLADNKVSEAAEWDIDLLKNELNSIELDMSEFGFDSIDDVDVYTYDDFKAGSLKEKYITAPFSVINGASKEWLDRKKEWLKFIHSEDGRSDDLLGNLSNFKKVTNNKMSGISVFDPVLVETMIAWFCPDGGKIIDPFAGGSVRGLVSSFTCHDYTGIDLRQEQIDANEKNYVECEKIKDFSGNVLKHPNWICGDSQTIDTLVNGVYDFMITCPPYADLETYSDDPRDISNMEYSEFLSAYKNIIHKTVNLLKNDSFAVIVVGEVRSKKGDYYNFVGDTINAFKEAGLRYYNEIIFTTPIGTAALRANTTFGSHRKVVKTHQNVLVFIKGNEKNIKLGEYKYKFHEDDVINE